MAVDRKADHVGNHGGVYTDLDGMTKQFTYIDHDKKTKIRTGKMSPEEVSTLKKEIEEASEKAIKEILSLPAVNALRNGYGLYEEFVVRNTTTGIIEWNDKMVREACKINDTLRYNLYLSTWRNTVKEQYWFEEISHEDILAGLWKKWT